jgi:alpha-glucosidase
MNKIVIFLFSTILIIIANCVQSERSKWTIYNGEKTFKYTLHLNDSLLTYQVDFIQKDGQQVPLVQRSVLGITRKDQDFTSGLSFVSKSSVKTIDETYRMLIGKQSEIRNHGLEQMFTFKNKENGKLQIIVRAYADGAAFRYRFPEQSSKLHTVTAEATEFHIPDNGKAWILPYDQTGGLAPSYENVYRYNIDIGTPAPETSGWAFPALFHTNGLWVLLTEADMDTTFYGAHMEQKADSGLYRIRMPEKEETFGVAPREPSSTLPWQTPWRTLIFGQTLGVIVESNLVYNLSAPSVIEDISWIKPGRVSWSWWSEPSSPRDYSRLVPFIDFAAKLGWEYSLIDYGWHVMKNGGDIRKLIAYAQSKGVDLIVWYNSGGDHNQVVAEPSDIMHDPVKRIEEMKKLKSWGIKGIKIDFMQSDNQYLMKMYQDIARDAAKFHLIVNFHGSTIPRGWSRTYPNMLSMEGVRACEQYWEPDFTEKAATLNTIYTYTRNVIGPMDYTPVVFGDSPGKLPHKTTNAHELALSVAFECGLQHFADHPRSYLAQPKFVLDFMKTVPVTWDETRYIDGTPGKLCVIARRKGVVWYVAGLNGETVDKSVAVPLSFLGEGEHQCSLITTGKDPRSFENQLMAVSKNDTIKVAMSGRDGFTMKIKVIKKVL